MTTQTAGRRPAATTPGSRRAQEILAIGAQLFEENGYAATTLQDIGDAAGVLPGSLYHHFESKDAIALELLMAFDDELTATARQSLRIDTADFGIDESRAHLRSLCRNLTDVIRRHAAAVRLRAYQAPLVAGPDLRRAVGADTPTLTRAWSAAISAVLRERTDRHPRPALLRFAFGRLTLAAAGTAYPPHISSDTIADELCDLLLDGLLVEIRSPSSLNTSAAALRAAGYVAKWRRGETPSHDPKARILAAARAEFARHGYEASTIRGIADTAGITMGTLYRRADSKDAILREILDRYSDHLDLAVRDLLSDVTSVAESLDALARLYVNASRRFAAEAAIVKLGGDAHEHPDSPFHEYLMQTRERLRLMEDVLGAGLRAGEVRRIGTAAQIAPHFRQVMWLPYQEHARTSEKRAHSFIREDVLFGGRTLG